MKNGDKLVIIGCGGAGAPAKEIDAVNALILGGKTITDLTMVMNAGNPDCASEPSKEPFTTAAEQSLQRLNVS